MTVLVSTAYLDEAARFHRLSLLSEGRVLASGTPAEVQGLVPGTMVTCRASPQIEAVMRLKTHFDQVESLGSLVHVFAEEPDHAAAVRRVESSLGDIQPEQVQVDDPELEDVFVALLLRQETGRDTVGPPVPSPGSRPG